MANEHEQIKSLLAAYALGSVPEDEVRQIRDHILSCDECMAEADAHSEATSLLALAVDPVELPAGFADRVMEQVRPSRPRLGAPPKKHPAWMTRLSPVALLGGAALLIALVVVGAVIANLQRDLNEYREALTDIAHGREWELEGPGGVVGEIVSTGGGSRVVLAALNEAPEGHTYQLWMMKGEACLTGGECEVVSAGTFEPKKGLGTLETDFPLSEYDACGVTIEPDGGSAEPTSDPIITGAA
jgi:anti-sigma-K factor RskA